MPKRKQPCRRSPAKKPIKNLGICSCISGETISSGAERRQPARRPKKRRKNVGLCGSCVSSASSTSESVRKRQIKKKRSFDFSGTSFSSLISSVDSKPPSQKVRKTTRCSVCGHTCCLRRKLPPRQLKRRSERTKNKRVTLTPGLPRNHLTVPLRNKGATACQADSRSAILSSPLLVGEPKTACPGVKHTEVTADMISEAVQHCGTLRANVTTQAIADYISDKYNVNPDKAAFMAELREKLDIADIAGIVTRTKRDTWVSPKDRVGTALSVTKVQLFDTMCLEQRLRTKVRASRTLLPDIDVQWQPHMAFDEGEVL